MEATDQVIAAARELKRSLMRHVFRHGTASVSAPEYAAWPFATLQDAVSEDRPICYGILKPGPDIPNGVPYLKVRDYPDGKLDVAKIHHTTHEIAKQYRRSQLRAGDILVSIRGTSGRIVVIPDELEGANITQDSARVTPSSEFDRDFLASYLQSEAAQNYIRSWTKGVAVRGINLRELRKLPVPLPPLAEQKEIARFIRAAQAKLDAEIQRRDALNALFKSLLYDLMSARFRIPEDLIERVA
jgi:type I restriction enzyme S subunit